jgi:radical SAM superfamily enzyme YgiQ (UPF0313 family)
MDFLLVNLPPWAQDNPHIGIGYLSAYLRKKDIKFKVLDLNKRFFVDNPDFGMLWHVENKNFWSNADTFPLITEAFGKDIDKAVGDIVSSGAGILGFSVVDPKERITIEFIKKIKAKAPEKKIILGGPATSTPEQRKIFLDDAGNHIDAFVVGEGEEALFYLIDGFLRKKSIKGAEGCFIKDNGNWHYKEKESMGSLDNLPFPTYREFDMSLYGKSLLVEWSRGCKGQCAFCKNYRLFSAYRSKSPDYIIKELRYHIEANNISEFTVTDNILNGDLNGLSEVCERVISGNLDIKWTGQIAPRKNMDISFFRKMRNAGCLKLQIGLESGSDKVLKAMKKTFTSEISEMNIRSAKRAGIETEIFVMIGFPSETERDFRKTFDFIKRNAKYIDTIKSINTLHLIAGTEIYEEKEKFGIKALPEKDWHYLWESYDGNNYPLRKRRAQRLLDLSRDLGLKVMEANIREGKESVFGLIDAAKDRKERLSLLKDSVNNLQELPERSGAARKRKGAFRWMLMTPVSFYTFFYITYFWVYMKLKNKVLLGGRKK